MKFLMFFVLSLCIGLNFACSSNDSSESNLPAITKKPIVINDSVKVGNTLKSTLSADHRVLDGAVAGKLLKDFNDIIEDPFQIWMNSNDMEVI